MLAELATLALVCAPNVHLTTLEAVVRHESSINQYAIGVNRKGERLKKQPTTLPAAIEAAQDLIERGIDFDAGLAQINVRNWDWLGLSAESVFDPCTNLGAAQTVLTECYTRALRTHQAEQQALRAALSCYNTGNLKRGFTNGYVRHVLAQAGVTVPAIESAPGDGQPAAAPLAPAAPRAAGAPDGFSANPAPDGFMQPEPVTPKSEPVPPSA